MAYTETQYQGSAVARNYKICMQVDVVGQEVGNNRTLIQYSAWVQQIGGGSLAISSGNGSININGYNPGRTLPGGFNFSAAGQRRYFAQNEQYWIGHDGNGDANPYFTAHMVPNANSVGMGGAEARMNVAMPHINRYININGWGIGAITEKSFNTQVITSGTADILDYQLNDGEWKRGYTGGFTDRTITVGGLQFNTQYSLRVRVRNASGGLWTTSDLKTLKTLPVTITSATASNVTDTNAMISVRTSHVADIIAYRLDSTSSWVNLTGSFTSADLNIYNLTPNLTYNIEIRARHQDSGVYTPSVFVPITTTLPTPLKPANMTPGGGKATIEQSPNLNWEYTSTSPDYQTAYQVILYDALTGEVIKDTGKVTSTAWNYQILDSIYNYVNITLGTTNITTNTITVTGTPYPNGWPVKFSTNGTLPAPLSVTTQYYVRNAGTNLYTIHLTKDDALANTNIVDLTSVGTGTNIIVPNRALQYGSSYQWKVRTWSSADIIGPYSDLQVFKLSRPPSITVTNPVANQILGTNTPTITWTYSDPEGLPQSGYIVTIRKVGSLSETTGEQIYTKTITGNSDPSEIIPSNVLENGGFYRLELRVIDADGIQGIPPIVPFGVQFVAPEPPSITAELSEDKLFTRVSVNTNKPDDDAYETDVINVFKREVGTVEWQELGQIQAISENIETFDNLDGWVQSAGASGVELNTNSKEGTYSTSFKKTGAQTAVFTKVPQITTLAGFDKIRLWAWNRESIILYSVVIKIGKDYQNYYSYTIDSAVINDQIWASIEINIANMAVTGTPQLNDIEWLQIEVNSQGNIPAGSLLLDGLRIPAASSSLFLYDYNLRNGRKYEYAASAYSTRQKLESIKTIMTGTVDVDYSSFKNTFVIPIGNETSAMSLFMDGDTVPSWTTKTDTQYYYPTGSSKPIAYSLDIQKYRQGAMAFNFLERKYGGEALSAAKQFERIMNQKPILLRTWWGENYYISVDGQITTSYNKYLGWKVSFNFTEIEV
jgi:hypothetical protein